MNLRQWRIGARLNLGFGLLIALLCAVSGLGLALMSRVYGEAEQLGTNWLPSVQALGEIRGTVNIARRDSLQALLAVSVDDRDRALASEKLTIEQKLPEQVAAYEKLISSDEERQLFDSSQADWQAYLALNKRIKQLLLAGDSTGAVELAMGEADKAFLAYAADVRKLIDLNGRGAAAALTASAASFRFALGLGAAGALLGVAVGSLLAWRISRSIVQPMGEALRYTETVAAGDLSQSVHAEGRDEPALLLQALGRMGDNLRRIVGDVRSASDSIATGSSQIASGNADLSQRTEEQASNLEETAASMEEMTGVVRTTAQTASEAAQLAQAAAAAANHGGEVVGQVVHTMRDINDASKKIADIIGTIDGIAFQTNILALNAAVEAARAGEQGRGFAVVAGEVRSLAQRSAEAAREIKTLISASVEKVEAGSRLVDDAGQSMTDIVAQVQKVNAMIAEISSAASEQTAGIGQVGDAVNQLDQVTQQNAALVEQSAAAAESLKHQAARLTELVGSFNLGHGSSSQHSGPVAHAAPAAHTRYAAPSAKPKATAPRPAAGATATPGATPHAPSAPAPAPATATAGGDDWETF